MSFWQLVGARRDLCYSLSREQSHPFNIHVHSPACPAYPITLHLRFHLLHPRSTLSQDYNIATSSMADQNLRVFSTHIFEVQIGPEKNVFMVHEGILVQSPLLARLVEGAASKKKKSPRAAKTIALPRETVENFGLLAGHLYARELIVPTFGGKSLLCIFSTLCSALHSSTVSNLHPLSRIKYYSNSGG